MRPAPALGQDCTAPALATWQQLANVLPRGATPALSLEAKGRYAPRLGTWQGLHSTNADHLAAVGKRLAKGRDAP